MQSPSTTVFRTDLVRIGAFRCDRGHPSFDDSGPAQNYCFVFPRTAVQIEHEHELPFVANPNVVTFYNLGSRYRRGLISEKGDLCDWFGVDPIVIVDVCREFDRTVDDRYDRPFAFTRAMSDSSAYFLQRRLFETVVGQSQADPLAVEELVVHLLERVLRGAYRASALRSEGSTSARRDLVHNAESVLSQRLDEPLSLRDVSRATGVSIYHLCRTFRRATGFTLHQYRHVLKVRTSLEPVFDLEQSLIDIAIGLGFSSHSHFTSAFHREFGMPPSRVRPRRATAPPRRGALSGRSRV